MIKELINMLDELETKNVLEETKEEIPVAPIEDKKEADRA